MDNPYESGLNLFNTRVIGNPYTLQQGLDNLELARVQQDLVYWKWYLGDQWTFKRPEGEPQNTINYSARFVDKGVAFLFGKGFTLNVHKNAEKITKPYLDKVWDDNDRLALGIEMGQSGGVTGNSWVKVSLEEYDKNEEPMLAEMYPKGRIRLTVLPSYACFPRWKNHDKETMERFRLLYPIVVYDKNDRPKTSWYREEITNHETKTYIDDVLMEVIPNDLGIIPVVRIKNLMVANQSFGKSDLQDIIPLNKEFNEKTTDVSDIIDYHASPITLVFGAKTNNLEKGARKIWGGLPKDAKVENLELKSDLKASMDYIALVKNAMFEIASMPANALGGTSAEAISNTSGIALQVQNQPLLDTNNHKRINYEKGIQDISRIILRIADVYELEDFDFQSFRNLKPEEKWFYDVTFPDPLPKDELIQMQLIAQKLNNHLITRIDALKQLGEYDAVSKLEEIKKDFIEWQNLMFEAMPGESLASTTLNGSGDITSQTAKAGSSTTQPNGQPAQGTNLGGVSRQKADLTGQSGRGHGKTNE